MKAILTFSVGMALFFAGCAPTPLVKKPEIDVAAQRLFDLAELDFGEGRLDEAIEKYERYLSEYPKGEKSRLCLLRLAEILYQKHRYETALALFRKAVEEYPDHPDLPKMETYIIDTLYRIGDYQQSSIEAAGWLDRYPMSPLRGDVFFFMGKNYRAMENLSKAFFWWLKAIEGPFDLSVDREDIDDRIFGLIQKARLYDLKEMVGYAAGTKYEPSIYHNVAYIYLDEDKLEESKQAAMALVRSTPDQYWVDIGRQILERIQLEMSVQTNAVGCLLPLSGPFAIYGQEVLNGIQLGMGLFTESEEGTSIELIIEDTEGKAEVAVSKVEELAIEKKVIAIIGPLASKTSEAAAKRAQELGIPIITLTQREGITAEGDMVFRNFMTASKDINRIVDKAINTLSLKRFGILYPNNSYGRFFMNLFWDRVEERGGVITAVESYQKDQADFVVEIKKMVGLHHPRPPSVAQMVEEMKWLAAEEKIEIPQLEKDPDPIVDFDAVFIPDNYQQVALITPQFPYHNIFDIRFLGTNLWQSPELIELAGDYVQGAIFPSGFFLDNESDAVNDFFDRYMVNYEVEPGILAATGYDTIRFLMNIMANGSFKTRKGFQKELVGFYDYHGLTGLISFDKQGEVKKDPLLLTVAGRRFRILP